MCAILQFVSAPLNCCDKQQKLEELCQSIEGGHESEVMIATKWTGIIL